MLYLSCIASFYMVHNLYTHGYNLYACGKVFYTCRCNVYTSMHDLYTSENRRVTRSWEWEIFFLISYLKKLICTAIRIFNCGANFYTTAPIFATVIYVWPHANFGIVINNLTSVIKVTLSEASPNIYIEFNKCLLNLKNKFHVLAKIDFNSILKKIKNMKKFKTKFHNL